MTVLITGAAGFLGLHLADFFARKGHRLILLDIADFEKREYPPQSQFIKGDVRDEVLINKITKDVDIIIHAAAALPLWKKEDIFAINVDGTKNILESALKNRVKRVIYISSTAVYGIPKRHPILENDNLVGVGPYGQSKIEAEKLCFQYQKKGLAITILRPKTFIGSHRLGVFEILFDWVKDGKKIPMVGSGKNRYQLLDVDDLVKAIYLFSTAKDQLKINTVFNIGAEKFATVDEDLQNLFDYAKSGSKIFPVPALIVKRALFVFEKLHLSPLYQWIYDTADKDSYVSINRLVKALDWRPRYSNSQALIKAYKWYKKHYQEIKSKKTGVTHTTGWNQGILAWIKKFL